VRARWSGKIAAWGPHGGMRKNRRRGLLFACGAAFHTKYRRRPIFWMAPDVRAPVTPYKDPLEHLEMFHIIYLLNNGFSKLTK
jgi:hypothetical protein